MKKKCVLQTRNKKIHAQRVLYSMYNSYNARVQIVLTCVLVYPYTHIEIRLPHPCKGNYHAYHLQHACGCNSNTFLFQTYTVYVLYTL